MARRFSSFLGRLTRAPAQSGISAIVRNLDHLLNTRKGCGSVVAELGVGDYEAAPTTHHAVLALRAELEQLVRGYEPRLAEPRVIVLGGVGARVVRFELRARIADEDQVFWLDIDAETRHFDVRPAVAR